MGSEMLSLLLSLLLLLALRASGEPWAQMMDDLAKKEGLEHDFNVTKRHP